MIFSKTSPLALLRGFSVFSEKQPCLRVVFAIGFMKEINGMAVDTEASLCVERELCEYWCGVVFLIGGFCFSA